MPALKNHLMGLVSICDTGFSVHFHKYTVTSYDTQGLLLLQGWRDKTGAKLWKFALCPQISTTSSIEKDVQTFTVAPKSGVKYSNLQVFSAYDLPRVEALVRNFLAAAGFPVKSMWLDAIKAVNFASCPGLPYQNEAKYCPSSDETLKGHISQTRHNVRSTKPKPAPTTKTIIHASSPTCFPTSPLC